MPTLFKVDSPSKSSPTSGDNNEVTPSSTSTTAAASETGPEAPPVASSYLPYTSDPNTAGLVTPSKSDSMELDEELMGPPPPALTAVTPTKEDGAKLHLPTTPSSHGHDANDCSSDTLPSEMAPSERSELPTASETSESEINMNYGQDVCFFRRAMASPSPATRYRIRCQCGAANCRQYLY